MFSRILFALFLLQASFAFAQIAPTADSIKPILIGQTIPDMPLMDAEGKPSSTKTVFATQNTVLIFYRGGWCPYCNVHLKEVGDIEKNLIALGYQVVAISPDAPTNLKTTFDKDSLHYQLFSDSKTRLMQRLGIAFQGNEKYKKLFLDASNGDNTEGVLPAPSVFFVDKSGKIIFSYINTDYKKRISGKLILAIATALEMPLVETKKDSAPITQTAVIEPTKTAVIEPPKTVVATVKTDIDADFNRLLSQYVSTTGKVNYKGLKTEKIALAAYIKTLQNNVPPSTASKATRMAYWANAYNALTIKLIVDNYPLSKITELDGGKPWDVKRYTFDGKKISLNDIENTILRPMGDARIHFAINCAAKSCPPLLNQVFTAENLDNLLDERTRQFINSSANKLQSSEITVSKIFDWYGKDFGNVAEFVAKYAKTKVSKSAKVGFGEYNWGLNE